MPRYTCSDDDRVLACPLCDIAGRLYRRVSDDFDEDEEVVCRDCKQSFAVDDVVEREDQSDPSAAAKKAKPQSGHARALMDAEPDAIGRSG